MWNQVNTSFDDFKHLLAKEELQDEPVPLDVFVQDKYYLGLPPLSPIQRQIVSNMTQIYRLPTLIKLHGDEEGKKIWESTVNEVVCQIGKGGGKDFSIRIAFLRIIYLLHCLKDPLNYYGMGGGEYIDLLNIALNSEQAQRVFFDPLKNIMINSPYFNSKGFMPMSKKIEFRESPIRCFSGHSEAEGWEGFNLMAVVLDEIAAFKVQEDMGEEQNRFSASAIYDMSRLSVASRFPDVGKLALLSFPRYMGDFIQRRYEGVIEESKPKVIKKNLEDKVEITWIEDEILSYREPRVWAIKCPTFISNPTKRPEDFISDFIRDPEGASARLLCMPPKMEEAYFRDPDRVRLCFHKHDSSCKEEVCNKPPFDGDGRMPASFRDPEGPFRYIHIDLGLKRDRSAVCMVHCKGVTELDDGTKAPVIKMDLIKYWQAPAKGEIDFNDIRRFVFALASRFRIAMITMDRWNSVDTARMFENKGLYTKFMVAKKDHYDTLATCIYDRRLDAYHHDILVEEELLKLKLIKGNKVDHPNTGFKDGADCLAGAVYTCSENAVIEETMEIEVLGAPKEKVIVRPPQPEEPKEMPEELQEFVNRFKVL